VDRSAEFFRRFGSWTIVLARFVPIVRTVATVMAGVGHMRFAIYALYSLIGGVVWTVGLILLGHGLGHIQFVRDTIAPKIDYIVFAAVLISMLPVVIHAVRGRRADRARKATAVDHPKEPVSGS
jgi:membrane-associated protein